MLHSDVRLIPEIVYQRLWVKPSRTAFWSIPCAESLADVSHQCCYRISLHIVITTFIIIIEHVVPVVGVAGEITNGFLWPFPVVHHLRNGCRYASRRAACRTISVIRPPLVPCRGEQRPHLDISYIARQCGGQTWRCQNRTLSQGIDGCGITCQQVLHLNGTAVVAERTVVAVAQHLVVGAGFARDDDETLITAQVDDVDIVLACLHLRLHAVGQHGGGGLCRSLSLRQFPGGRVRCELAGNLQGLFAADVIGQRIDS